MTILSIGSLAILVAAIWPLARLCAMAAFRRKLLAFPRAAAAVALFLTGYAAGVVWLAVDWPAGLMAAGGIAAVALIAERVRARPGYGRRRRLPPGSLALASAGPWIAQDYFEKQFARYGPIFKISHFGQPTVCIVGLRRARSLLQDHDDALVVPPVPFNRFIPRGFLRYMSREDHRRYSALFRGAITKELVARTETALVEICRHHLARAAASSQVAPAGVRPLDFLGAMVLEQMAVVVLGIDRTRPAFGRLGPIYASLHPGNAWRLSRRRALRTLDELSGLLRARDGELQSQAGAPASLLETIARTHPGALDDPTARLNLAYICLTAWTDVTGLLCWIVKMLGDHPDWLVRARRGRDESNPPLGERIVLETLRLEQSEYLVRRTLRDIEIDGYVIPKGWLIRVCVRESHRTSGAFTDPARFDPDRFARAARSNIAPFGASRILCPGEGLTMSVGAAFVNELARGFEMTVVSDGKVEYGGFHWRPGVDFRIALVPREAPAAVAPQPSVASVPLAAGAASVARTRLS